MDGAVSFLVYSKKGLLRYCWCRSERLQDLYTAAHYINHISACTFVIYDIWCVQPWRSWTSI